MESDDPIFVPWKKNIQSHLADQTQYQWNTVLNELRWIEGNLKQ